MAKAASATRDAHQPDTQFFQTFYTKNPAKYFQNVLAKAANFIPPPIFSPLVFYFGTNIPRCRDARVLLQTSQTSKQEMLHYVV